MSNSKLHDLTGQKFGRLTVIGRAADYVPKCGNKFTVWHCKCECGEEKDVLARPLVTGSTRSCGCLSRELTKRRSTKHGGDVRGKRERLYNIWANMKARCSNQNDKFYYRYGGRGIKICDKWKEDYKAFRDWAYNNGYSDELSIDRIDNDGDYCPDNCRWATATEQAYNRKSNRYITAIGKTQTISEWSKESGLKITTIHARIAKGWSEESAVATPVRRGYSCVSR